MKDDTDSESESERALVTTFEKLRKYEGLTVARIAKVGGDATSLLRLPAVQRYANMQQMDLPSSAVAVVKSCIRDATADRNMLICDVALGLGIFAEAFANAKINSRIVENLACGSLMTRRRTLLAAWRQLHLAVGVTPIDVPSDRSFREEAEREALLDLVRHLLDPDRYRMIDGPDHRRSASTQGANSRSRRLVVVGGAVMDATFSVSRVPGIATSEEAYGFRLAPGGKGLVQAIAAARLGIDVSFVAAIADDDYGRRILSLLHSQRVDTSMVKIVRNEATPFTGVIERDVGDSLAVNWRNESKVSLDVRDVQALGDRVTNCGVMLVTFEIPRDTVQYILAAAHERGPLRPISVVTPGQPYRDKGLSGLALSQIDYMVAHEWELRSYQPSEHIAFNLETVSSLLLSLGVGNICVPMGQTCRIFSSDLGLFQTPALPTSSKESAMARDAFCAALAARLLSSNLRFSTEVARWAAAAGGATDVGYDIRTAVPDEHRIMSVITRASRQSQLDAISNVEAPPAHG